MVNDHELVGYGSLFLYLELEHLSASIALALLLSIHNTILFSFSLIFSTSVKCCHILPNTPKSSDANLNIST